MDTFSIETTKDELGTWHVEATDYLTGETIHLRITRLDYLNFPHVMGESREDRWKRLVMQRVWAAAHGLPDTPR